MATPQTYTPVGDVSIPTTIPKDLGGTILAGPSGGTELKYTTCRDTDAQLFEEIQNLVGTLCRATVTGLSTASVPVTPRAALFKIQQVVGAMLTQPVG